MREEILDIITQSIRNVEREYFKLKTTYEPSGIVRERVFCYELYHQIRKLQDTRKSIAQLSLNGEIDKRGHIRFDKEDQKNPDFIIHIPGKMEGNTSIIQVKGTLETNDYLISVFNDIKTMLKFIKKYGYEFEPIRLYV